MGQRLLAARQARFLRLQGTNAPPPEGGRSALTGLLNIVWFKRDLRLTDHRPLASAAGRGPVLPLYIAEPELWAGPDASERQWAFVAESLVELR